MTITMAAWSLSLLLLLLFVNHVQGWVTPISLQTSSCSRQRPALALSSVSSSLGGVDQFDEWFSKLDKASCQSSIQHASFGSLRGLECAGNENGEVLKVPKSVILSSSYADEDWDAQLAVQLWNECIKGRSSELFG